MFKDIAYIIRSPLYLACIIAALWGVTEIKIFDSNVSFILGLFYIPFLGLTICYLTTRIFNSVWKTKSWNGLPAETKYGAVILWCMVCTAPSSAYSTFSIPRLLLIPTLIAWAELGTSWFTGPFTSLFEETIRFKEFALSVVLTFWFLALAAVFKFGFIIGGVIGIVLLLASPLLVMLCAAILQSAYRLIGHEFFIRGENGKFVINRGSENARPLSGELGNGKPAGTELSRIIFERAKILSELYDDIKKLDFDNDKVGLANSLASYERWKDETHKVIAQRIGFDEAKKFRRLGTVDKALPRDVDAKIAGKEIQGFLPYLKSLTIAIDEGKVEVNTKVMQHKRHRVIHKLYDLSLGGRSGNVVIDDLAKALELSSRETGDVLDYWEGKGLIESTGQTVKLTPFGVDEVEKLIESPEKSKSNKRIAILFFAADPSDAARLRLGREHRDIELELQLSPSRDAVELQEKWSVRVPDISRALLNIKPQVVHFSGHGTEEGALCFEDEEGRSQFVQPDDLASLFELLKDDVNCVVLNACFSQIQAKAIAQHIPCVIGMSKAISDDAAIAFAVGFYQALGARASVEDAYKFGCVQIRLKGIPEHLTPVLIKKQ